MIRGLFSRRAPVTVQPFFGYRNTGELALSARALRRRHPRFDKSGFWGSFAVMVRQYASHEVPGLEVTLEYETASGQLVRDHGVTDKEGFAHFTCALPAGCELPLDTGWERVVLRWTDPQVSETREREGFVLAPGRRAGLAVISDIDDTILETGITGDIRAVLRNWRRVMAQMPGERVVVPGASDFYSALGGSRGDAGVALADSPPEPVPQAWPRPVFYVSSSPWNLFSYLVTFKQVSQLPIGPVMLRDWGFNSGTLGSSSHGSHKRDAVARILDTYPQLRFVLVGDDTQKDLEVFGAIAADQPHRIAAVFIRAAGTIRASDLEKQVRERLDAAGVPFWMGGEYGEARAFLASVGLEFDPRMETLVEVASEGEEALDDLPTPPEPDAS